MSGNLPPGVRDVDIDMAAPGYDDPPYYCWQHEHVGAHCANYGDGHQCRRCQEQEYLETEQESEE